MKILYDYQAFTMQYFGGVSKCFCELISNLPEDVKSEIAIKQSNNVHLWESGLVPNLQKVETDWNIFSNKYNLRKGHIIYDILCRVGLVNGAEQQNQRLSIDKLIYSDFDVFHPTFFNPYFLKYIGRKPWVITVHDMMPEKFPQYFRRDSNDIVFKQKYLREANAIVAVSNTTKKDLVEIVGIPANKIVVIPHGGPKVERIIGQPLIKSEYFLYVGGRTAYKNFKQTLIDFAVFHKSHPFVELICTGNDFNVDEQNFIDNLQLRNTVKHVKANEEELKNLYAFAIAFIYPSLYEGFGMPILEAYAYGCPVMLNNIPVFQEVADEAAIYFSSEDGNSNISDYLNEVYNMNSSERNSLINKGYKRLSKFSWKKSSKRLADLYMSLI